MNCFSRWLAPLLLFAVCTGVSAQATPPPQALMRALDKGVNLSIWYTYRHFDGIDPARWYPDAADWRQIKALGLHHVRVQFDPAFFRDAEKAGALRSDRVKQLQRDLAPAWAAGLVVVLAAEPEGPEKSRLVKDDAGIAELASFWRSFAGALSAVRPDRLVFEALNEPTDTDAPRNRYLMQQLAEAIRAAAPAHTIVVEGHGYSGIDELLAFEPLTLPNLIYSFHFYEPFTFTHQGAFWGWPMFLKFQGLPYPSSPEALQPFVDKAEDEVKPYLQEYGTQNWNSLRIEARLDLVSNWARDKRVAIWCGEFGVTRLGPPLEDRPVWLAHARRAMEARAIPWALFDYVGHFGLLTGNAGQRELDTQSAAALALPVEASRP
jgi:endoglucanase